MDQYIVLETEKTFTSIVYDHYKNLDYLNEIMDENRKLLKKYGQFIPAGETVKLPRFESPRPRRRESLWTR